METKKAAMEALFDQLTEKNQALLLKRARELQLLQQGQAGSLKDTAGAEQEEIPDKSKPPVF